LESTGERQTNCADRFLFEKRVTRSRDNADDFDRLVRLFPFVQIGAPSSVSASASLGRWSIRGRILNALSKGVAIWPEFLSQNFVNHRDLRPGLGRFHFGEGATAHDR